MTTWSLKLLLKVLTYNIAWQNQEGEIQTPGKQAFERLSILRKEQNRPADLHQMSISQLRMERSDIGRELIALREWTKSEKISKEEKIAIKDLYSRYCEIKDIQALLARADDLEGKDRKVLEKEKKELQIVLFNYQEEFQKENGRPLDSAGDWGPVRAEYKRYKVDM